MRGHRCHHEKPFPPESHYRSQGQRRTRATILQEMYNQDYITKEEQEEALADDVYSRIQNVDLANKENDTPYSYYTDELIEQVTEALKEELGYTDTQASNLLFSGGLSIYTPQDPKMQAIVDEEISNPANYALAQYSIEYRLSVTHADGTTEHFSEGHVKNYFTDTLGQTGYTGLFGSEEEARAAVEQYKSWLIKEGDSIIGESLSTTLQPQASFVLIEQSTGEVKAISGGRGEKKANRTLNRATNAKRQPGSAFKVITSFLPAVDTCGATLGSVYYDAPYSIGDKSFRNWYANRGYMGYHNIREGIAYSMNIITLKCLVDTVTPQLGVEYAKKMGITTLVPEDVTPSLGLGGLTLGVTNLEMTDAFASIANGGEYREPVFFTKILDHNGKVLIENEPEPRRVMKILRFPDHRRHGRFCGKPEPLRHARFPAQHHQRGCCRSRNVHLWKSGTTTSNNDLWFVALRPTIRRASGPATTTTEALQEEPPTTRPSGEIS